MNSSPSILARLRNFIQPGRRVRSEMDGKVNKLKVQIDVLKARVTELKEKNALQKTELNDARKHSTDEPAEGYVYNSDCLRVWRKNLSFLTDEKFKKAYATGMNSGHRIGRAAGSKDDIHIEWRVHMNLWAARHAAHLEGDFVECGVNTGIMSLAICDYLDFNKKGKSFYLFDTYEGIPVALMQDSERTAEKLQANKEYYFDCYEQTKANFSAYPSAVLVKGMVPDTLTQVDIQKVAYLSIDMNIVAPEIAAMNYFWDKLVPGAVVVLDDYGWKGYELQKQAMDDFARSKGVEFATLPTAQGLLIKP